MRRIALVGTTETSKDAPFSDESWEIWGVACRAAHVIRADRWFELHRISGEPQAWQDNWRKQLKVYSHDLELWMFYPEEDLGPNVITYPMDQITGRFGTYFMTSSFAWMMGLAIDELCPHGKEWEPAEIGIWGVEMEYGTEYRQQRVGFRHFIDLARVMGIQVTRMVESGLAYEPVPYPFWQDDPLRSKLEQRSRLTTGKLNEYGESLRNIRTLITQNTALIEEINKSKKKGYRSAKRIVSLEKELGNLMSSSAELSRQITQAEGANEEQRYFQDYLEP